jgi:phage tail-like protein
MYLRLNDPHDPFLNFRYKVIIQGIQRIGFSSVTGIGNSTEVEERKPQCHFTTKLVPGLTRYEPIVLTRGLSKLSFFITQWRDQVFEILKNPGSSHNGMRRDITIKILDKDTRKSISIKVFNCWPSSITGPDLNALEDNIAFSTLTLQNEGQSIVYDVGIPGDLQINQGTSFGSSFDTNVQLPKLRLT